MNKNDFAFGKENFMLIGASVVLIIVGFALMISGSTTEEAFNPEIFDTRRIVISPTIVLTGFITMIYAIVRKSKVVGK